MMRILVVMRNDLTIHGGDLVMMNEIAEGLRARGHCVDIVTVSTLPAKSSYDLVHAVALFYVPNALMQVFSWCIQHAVPLAVSPLMEDMLAQWYHDALRSKPKWQALSCLFGVRLGQKIHRTWHLSGIRRSDAFRKQREVLAASHVIVNTQLEATLLRSWFSLDDLQPHVCHLGIDVDHFDPKAINLKGYAPCSPGYVLQVSRIQHHKNQYLLIQALMDIPCDIVLAGAEFPYEPEYFQRCMELGRLRGRVHILGRVPYEHLPDLYHFADVHVLPSWSERPGLVTIEAAAMGAPVVSTTNSTIGEYLPDLVNWCDPGSQISIRNATVDALHTPVDRVVLSKQARQYSWSATVDKIEDVYEIVAGART